MVMSYVVSQGIDQFDDIGPSVVMASPGMMQVCSFTCAQCKVCYMIGQFLWDVFYSSEIC